MAAWLPLRAVSGLGLVHCSLYLAALGEGGGVPYQLTDETEAPAAWGRTWGPLKETKGQECPPPASFPVPREHSHSGDVTGSRVAPGTLLFSWGRLLLWNYCVLLVLPTLSVSAPLPPTTTRAGGREQRRQTMPTQISDDDMLPCSLSPLIGRPSLLSGPG